MMRTAFSTNDGQSSIGSDPVFMAEFKSDFETWFDILLQEWTDMPRTVPVSFIGSFESIPINIQHNTILNIKRYTMGYDRYEYSLTYLCG